MAGVRRSRCPVSCTLDVIGDRWSLLVVRDLMRGKRRFAEFAASPEGIPTNILAERLKRLRAKGIVRTERYSDRPPRVEYVLTAKGEDLRPMMRVVSVSAPSGRRRNVGGSHSPPRAKVE